MSLFFIWLGVMFPLVFSPGPANIVFAASGARVGLRKSLPLLAGVDLVFIAKSLLIGLGLGQVVQNHPDVMNVVQLTGAGYLIYLSIAFMKSAHSACEEGQRVLGFLDGLLIQILNSKGWFMVFLMFSIFSEQAQKVFGEQGIYVLVVWLALLNISMHLVWVKIGFWLSEISSSEQYAKGLNLFYAVCLFVVSCWLIVTSPVWG